MLNHGVRRVGAAAGGGASQKRRMRIGTIAAAVLALIFAGLLNGAKAYAAESIALLPIKFLNTSAEPSDQSGEHARRLQTFDSHLVSDLSRVGTYNVVEISAEELKKSCPEENAKCLLSAARQRGAAFVLVGVIHKSSTLILQMFVRLYSVKDEKEVLYRDLNFRGDNDEAWQRAEAFLVEQLKGALPR